MKILYILPLLILFFACTGKETSSDKQNDKTIEREIVVTEFQAIMDSAEVEGAILIYDLEADIYYSNDFKWANKGQLPASTFKITNSIIALETGTVENDSTLFKWDGEDRRMKNWEQDLILRDAFHFSCVPCYQEVARKIGVEKMITYLDTLEYGNMQIDSKNIDLFWLQGASRITQFEQIDFIKRFYQSKLPISERTEMIMKRMMVVEVNDHYKLSGKTGWSSSNGINNGWFVGYVEAQNNTYFFATNVEPQAQFDMAGFPEIRKEVTMKAFEQMEIID
ncbi:class D beta-lactamase [Marivirga sp. S37H4]|uniref:beta-lactamase n=1 Tax=Marivirga aurantiaca TaxID=2802615 RepID=A0A935CA56_9BACT|nr:class D beta-lactamase [Marivirga aurantiaca]MBK6266349.1 class D beta-lactamase [Marivirga aurantiaca]